MLKKKNLLFLVVLLNLITLSNISFAQCSQPPEEGNWVNTDSNTRSITRVTTRFICQDQVLNGQPCCPTGPAWYIHLYGSCSPTACDWGEVGAQRLSTGHIYGFYDQGFAKRYVYIKMSQYQPGKLWMYIYNDFVDPNRADYEIQTWFNKN